MRVIDKLINKNLHWVDYIHFSKTIEEGNSFSSPLITISREKGAGGRIIAEELTKKLGSNWTTYHKEIIDRIAEELHTDKEKVLEIDEKDIHYMEEVIGELFGRDYLDLTSYHRSLLKVLTAIAAQGNAVIVGRGANFLFPHALKIRIIADPEQRIRWLIKYEGLSEKEAKETIENSDEDRAKFARNIFNKDGKDPRYYDLVIKTSEDFPVKKAVELIANMALKRYGNNKKYPKDKKT